MMLAALKSLLPAPPGCEKRMGAQHVCVGLVFPCSGLGTPVERPQVRFGIEFRAWASLRALCEQSRLAPKHLPPAAAHRAVTQ